MSENKINRIKEYCKENIKENKKDKLQVIEQIVSCQYDNISKNRDFLDELWKIFIIFL